MNLWNEMGFLSGKKPGNRFIYYKFFFFQEKKIHVQNIGDKGEKERTNKANKLHFQQYNLLLVFFH